MPDVLLPRLTELDERVLAAVPREGAIRARDVIYDCRRRASSEDVLQILRGLERLGLLRCGRGGWWRRA